MVCTVCKQEKGFEFYKHRAHRNGYASECIPCSKVMHKKNRNQKLANLRVKRWVKKHGYITQYKYRKEQPEKELARNRFLRAVKSGKIRRPELCSKCQLKTKVEGHHPDYSKPYDVIWVCRMCHAGIHKDLKILKLSIPSEEGK